MKLKNRFLFKCVTNHHFSFAVLLCVVVLADQLSKHFMLQLLSAPPHQIKLLPFLNITLAWNTGISFSLFSSSGDVGRIVLSLISGLLSIILFVWYCRESNMILRSGLIMVLGGAIGNLIDRIIYGAVIDFIHVFYKTFSWPVFNIADTFITFGVSLILLTTVRNEKGPVT